MSPLSIASMLEIDNLHLKEQHRSHISNILKRIQENAPRGAIIRGSLKRDSRAFEGNIRISSKAGVFFAKARSRSILSLMVKLQSKLTRQLIKWKERRIAKRALVGREFTKREPTDI